MADLLRDRVVAAIGDVYDVEAEIGRGGAGVVYRARDVRLRRPVAVKILPPDLAFREDIRRRFQREAETAAGLTHPNIVPIYSVDERDGLVYFVMALVDGENLGTRLQREPRPPLRFVQRVLVEVADALAYAHARGVVHRDVKPDNILIDQQGRPVVTDFGIAHAAGADQRLTVTGVAIGTPAYMSPEQAMGDREVDGRSDIYSLGVVGYQMLAGEPPFRAASTPAMLLKHLGEAPSPLAKRRPDVPRWLVEPIERALAKKPADRWPDAAAFRVALSGDPAAEHAYARASGGRERPRPPVELRRTPVGGVAAVAKQGSARDAGGVLRPLVVPPVPPLPPFIGWGREDRRVRREEQRERQRLWREQQREWRRTDRHGIRFRDRPVAERIRIMRASMAGYGATVLGLAGINFVTTPDFPWFLFPAMGMGIPLLGQMGSLWADGIGLRQVLQGPATEPAAGGSAAPSAAASAVPSADPDAAIPLARRVDSFRRWAGATAWVGGTAAATLAVGAPLDFAPLFPVFLGSAAAAPIVGLVAVSKGLALKRLGLRIRDVLRGTWRQTLATVSPRLAAQVLAEEISTLASPEVLAGPYGGAVRRAAEDRATTLDVLQKLPAADRALIPDVAPTVNALVQRVTSLAGSLHRIDADVSPGMLAQLDARVAEAEREASGGAGGSGGAERERKLALLQRQQATLRDLLQRRTTFLSQIESAGLALQNLRLDLLKLRSSGVGSSLADLTHATQEARALSRDIAHVLDAAAEVRGI